MKEDIIISIDIGGTTFESAILDKDYLNIINMSSKSHVRDYSDSESLLDAICYQINNLLDQNEISQKNIQGLSVACPGPLDSKNGIILDTPNIKFLQNVNIKKELEDKCKMPVYIENDANLFSLGEWYSHYKQNNIVVGVTLGTGLGFGLIINGELFKGGNGFAMEYGLSPFEWGICEKNVCISYIKQRSKELYGEEVRPVIIEKYVKNNDKKAIQIYDDFGENLGIVLSHIVNMIDPEIITIGGGLSKAFECYKDKMSSTLQKFSPSFNINNITISPSILRGESTMIGASLMVKKYKLSL